MSPTTRPLVAPVPPSRAVVALALAAALGSSAPAPRALGDERIAAGWNWDPVTSANRPRSRTALVYFPPNDRFYLVGGLTTGGTGIPIEEYEVETDTWTDRSTLLTGVWGSGAAVVGERVVLGGTSGTAPETTHYVYDTVAGTWETAAPTPIAVVYATAASDGRYIYLAGGNSSNLINVERFDPVTDSWETMPSMNAGRGGAASFFDGSRIRVVSGNLSNPLNSTESFDGSAWHFGAYLGAAYGNGVAVKAAGRLDGTGSAVTSRRGMNGPS